jgi:hypothetical protein
MCQYFCPLSVWIDRRLCYTVIMKYYIDLLYIRHGSFLLQHDVIYRSFSITGNYGRRSFSKYGISYYTLMRNVWSVNSEFLCFNCNFYFAPLWRMGPRCSSAETQVCHRSYIIAARGLCSQVTLEMLKD